MRSSVDLWAIVPTFVFFSILGFILIAFALIHLLEFRCPRCHQRFLGNKDNKVLGEIKLGQVKLQSSCRNCGLQIGE
jgi:hypothetical protein